MIYKHHSMDRHMPIYWIICPDVCDHLLAINMYNNWITALANCESREIHKMAFQLCVCFNNAFASTDYVCRDQLVGCFFLVPWKKLFMMLYPCLTFRISYSSNILPNLEPDLLIEVVQGRCKLIWNFPQNVAFGP